MLKTDVSATLRAVIINLIMATVQVTNNRRVDDYLTTTIAIVKKPVCQINGKLAKELSDEEYDNPWPVTNHDSDQCSNEYATRRRGIKPSSFRRSYTSQSTPSGVSEEYVAMANACSHDHDYLSSTTDISPRAQTVTSMGSVPSLFGKANFRKQPVNPVLYKVKREQIDGGKIVPSVPVIKIEKDLKTQPRARLRTRRVGIVCGTEETISDIADNFCSTSKEADSKSTNANTEIYNREIERNIKYVTEIEPRKIENSLVAYETPGKELDVDITSPRPSITPFPPTERRRSRKGTAAVDKRRDRQADAVDQRTGSVGANEVEIENASSEIANENCKASVDSAYSSLTFSATSIPRTPSGNRPPSGGKRGATCGLTSSSSSGASSDEWSDVESPEKATLKPKNVIEDDKGILDSNDKTTLLEYSG